MAWLKIEDPDKSWELLHAGLLWFKSRDEIDHSDGREYYYSYSHAAYSWHGCRDLWCTGNDYYRDSKYVLLEE